MIEQSLFYNGTIALKSETSCWNGQSCSFLHITYCPCNDLSLSIKHVVPHVSSFPRAWKLKGFSVGTTGLQERNTAFTHLQGCSCSNMEWSPVGREGQAAFGDLCESWWPAFRPVLQKAALLVSPECYLQNFLPFSGLEFGEEPQKGTSCWPCTVRTSRKFLIHPSRASRDPVQLFNWHTITRAHKRGPVITPAPSPIRCPSQTAHGPSQIAPAIYFDPPTMSRRISDKGHVLDLHPSCPCCGTLR